MAKKVQLKTNKNNASVLSFIDNVEDAQLRNDSKQLLALFKDITGVEPKMWGGSIIGFGEYTYHRSNGDEGTFLATGFSPRKSGPTIYIMPGYQAYDALLTGLGPHKLGKSCLYLKNLDGIDLDRLRELIETGLADLKKTHETSFS